MKTTNIKNSTNVPASQKSAKPVKKSKNNEKPMAFWFFILFVVGIAFSLVAWLGSIYTDFPWVVLCVGCVFVAYSIGLWLWGYSSHKPRTKVEVRYVYVCKDTPNQVVATSEVKSEESKNFLEEIFNDPDLQDDVSESSEDPE